jgi:ligand-binding sensor domain-containing protein/serine phosphatase RsbU (regulator of sigma subunit)
LHKILLFLLSFTLLFGCKVDTENTASEDKELLTGLVVPFDTIVRYSINAFNGDSISPIINSMGDTVPSGKKIAVHGKPFIPVNNIRPRKVKAQKAKNNSGKTLQSYAPINVERILLNRDSLHSFPAERNDATHFLLNSIGDTIPTGIPIKTSGRAVNLKQVRPTKALAPVFMDDASVNMRYLDMDQGMNASGVWAIMEDQDHKLWIGTDGGGLSCYNGHSFYHYTQNEGLVNNIVISLLNDSKGTLWIGSYGGGLAHYDGNTLVYFDDKNGLIDNTIWSILEDSKGNIWVGSELGISRYDGEAFTNFSSNEGLVYTRILSIDEDKEGTIWFSTLGSGVYAFDGTSFTSYAAQKGLSSKQVFSIKCTTNGGIWFGTPNEGVFYFDGESYTQYGEDQGIPLKNIWAITEDKKGNMWFASQYDGVYQYDGNVFTNFSEKEGLSNNFIRSLDLDSKGNIWIGSDFGGVNRYVDDSFVHFSEKEGLASNVTSAIEEDTEGNIWISHYGFGLSIYDGSHFSLLTENEGLMDKYVICIESAKNGDLWFGSYWGLCKYDGEYFSYYEYQVDIPHADITCMLEDSDENLWIGTYNDGVYAKKGDEFIQFSEKEGFNSRTVNSLLEDKDGKIWIGTSNGIGIYSDSSFTYITEKEGLSSNDINCIELDQNGHLWIATQNSGINYFDGYSFTYISEKEGLSNNAVQSLTLDQDGNIWAGTEKGLSKISFTTGPAQNSTLQYSIQNLTQADGLKGIDFKKNSSLKDQQNRLWFGNIKGVTMLAESNADKATKDSLHVQLNYITINEKFIDFREFANVDQDSIHFTGVKDFENYPFDLELDHYLNHLNFHFSAIDWAAPHKISYSYRLLGLNSKWSSAGNETQADYRNIPFGDFTFQVRAKGQNGEWSNPFSYSFKINPPWWQSWPARIAYALFVILMLMGYVRWRTAQLKTRQKELETEVEIATHEIKKQHKEITDSIAYARRIQFAILPHGKVVKEYLQDSFILYKPKDVVAGDFYWMRQIDGKTLYAAADCTGHGVPGAMVSVVCNNALNRAVREYGLSDPGLILDKAREIVVAEFEKSEDDVKDGMDIALCCLEGNTLRYAGAHNPLWIIRNKELMEIKADKQPVGKHLHSAPFTSHYVELEKGDLIYIFTDGFVDQFGGELGKKFKIAAFRKLILEIEAMDMEDQRMHLDEFFEAWRGKEEQVDDVCVIGVRV